MMKKVLTLSSIYALCSMPGDWEMKDSILKVYLQPRSSRNEIIGPYRDGIKVKVTAPPAEGKANEALLQLLAKELDVAPSCIEIVKGYHSREKTLRISNSNPNSNPLTLQRKSISLKNGSG